MHIIDRVRFVLKDKEDSKTSKDEKIKMINDWLDELTTYIPDLWVVKLVNTTNTHDFILPDDFDEVYTLNLMDSYLEEAFFNYNYWSLVEWEHYVIHWNTLTLLFNSNYSELNIWDTALNLQYYKKFNYLLEDEFISKSWDTLEVTDSSIYNLLDNLLIWDLEDENEFKVLQIVDGTHIRINWTYTWTSKTIVWDCNLDNNDLKILEYQVQTMYETLWTTSNYTRVKWKTDKIEEEYTRGNSNSQMKLQWTTAYWALQKKLKMHKRYKFNRAKVDSFTLII